MWNKDNKQNKGNKQKKGPVLIVCDGFIIFLCIVLIITGGMAVHSLRQEGNYHYSENSFYYRLEDEDYSNMVDMYYINKAGDLEETENLKEYYGVAKYFEAASYYKMYEKEGDAVRAEKQKEKMEEAASEMGDFSFVQKDIKRKLNITE